MSRTLLAPVTLAFAALLTLMLSGCASQPASSPEKIRKALNAQAGQPDDYILGPTDVVQVSVWRNPDLSVSVPVRPDGRISVPLVGDVQASGERPEALAASIEDDLEQYIREPQVSVVVTGMGSHEFTDRVRVTGAVQQPTSVAHREGMTVLDMVLSSGGATSFAALNDAMLYRPLDGEVVAIPVKLDDILNKGDIETNYALQPGDILTVPERSF
ncbi:polysaccharide export outer membrane protein [Tamilnaduibacter salinus]|uniref:Polysaccharide export outer membrane protein n=1 Tax=Tamilnaduibacter salinus TaxID=1484056 RepID=A0A2A2I7N5_9GAMM|nr:XrtA/PEP-CTERM system exopolysaccharide export protein [Tamilnaduibacter salinus]PAV27053.1 sugar ABC transporter substrate-binding protein [Tamilnaduibacter salinus]PVY78328.1 polysaccharide export outer membrane protein [Tamilnaduibacter salinus]